MNFDFLSPEGRRTVVAAQRLARSRDEEEVELEHLLAALLDVGRARDVAMAAPARSALTYFALRDQVQRTVSALNGLGIRRNDTVAIVLPNGPELACAFLGIAAAASAAPPASRMKSRRRT